MENDKQQRKLHTKQQQTAKQRGIEAWMHGSIEAWKRQH